VIHAILKLVAILFILLDGSILIMHAQVLQTPSPMANNVPASKNQKKKNLLW
jgi:hypothetical protein